MHTMTLCCALAAALSGLLLLPFSLMANTAKTSVGQAALQASATASLDWLKLLDSGNYNGSWDHASALMKMTVPKDEWNHMMTRIRKPLGTVKSREVLDQRTAKDPKGLPEGDYMVMFYKTVFSNKDKSNELVTLYLEDGSWRVLTYQVD